VFKQQPITAVEREQKSGYAAPKQPTIAQDWACMIGQLLHDQLTVVQVSDPPAVQRNWLITQIRSNVHNIYMVAIHLIRTRHMAANQGPVYATCTCDTYACTTIHCSMFTN